MKSPAALLNQFALAVDNVEDAVCDRLRQLLTGYFLDKAKAFHFEVLMDGIRIDTNAGNKPGLQTRWTAGEPRSIPIVREEGAYRGQCALAYDQSKKLWVTSVDDRPLRDPDAHYVDEWSGVADLPSYVPCEGGEARTSILIPLRYGGRVFGVACIEFERKLSCSDEVKRELDLMFDALARIIWLNHTTNTQLGDTKRALEELEKRFGQSESVLEEPSLFFAASSRADELVVRSIREVLSEKAAGQLRLVVWDELHRAGPINPQIVEAISSARYGVCYLSEPIEGPAVDGQLYSDNRNVLFEAGMFEALAVDTDSALAGWVPIRERREVAGDPPFDMAGHRMVFVPRSDDHDGMVDEAELKEELARQLDGLITETA